MVPRLVNIDCSAQEVAADLLGAWYLAADQVNEIQAGSIGESCVTEQVLDAVPLMARYTVYFPEDGVRMVDADLAFFRFTVMNGPSFRVMVVRDTLGNG